jgi:outer membrane protein TolC
MLFDGAKTSSEVKAAEENIQAARQSFRFVSSEIRYRLRTAFVSLLRAQELARITEEIRQIRRSNLELITLRYESGIEHRGALLTAEANVAEADFEIARAERALEVAQRQLLREMGRQGISDVRVQGDFEVSVPKLERKDFELLAETHPSLGKLLAQKNSALYGIKSAEADFFPSLSATAGAGKSNNRWPPEYDQWNAGVTLSWPIFEGGLRKAEVSLAQSKFRQLESDELSVKGSLIVSLEQSWAGLLDAVETVEVQKKFLSAYEARSRIAEEQYSLGLVTFDDWTIIEDNLVSAKKNFLEARVSALQAEANWIQAKGETLEYAQ